MLPPSKNVPRRKDNRLILQFDYDCFYAQVLQNRDPVLKTQPLGVKQKNILATCNYPARRCGVAKLMLVSEAKRICPELVLVDGEDLTPFRDVSKRLYRFLCSHSWNNRVERLGFDEVFMDVTDIVDYNISCINQSSMQTSFFCLSRLDPQSGFVCDLTSVAGCLVGPPAPETCLENHVYLRLLLGSHLAHYLRCKLESDFGYTSTCGIATNKLLAKLAGGCNKPQNQTTLLALEPQDSLDFLDKRKIRDITGLGSKTAHSLESYVLNQGSIDSPDSHVNVRQIRQHKDMSPALLESLLAGPGSEKGIGARVWALLHGVDPTEVKEASDIPSQISIEDTYKGLETMAQITEELHKLSCSLIRRMRTDLVAPLEQCHGPSETARWTARPKTLRLSARWWPSRQDSHQSHAQNPGLNYNRVSRSGLLPGCVFDLSTDIEPIAQQLVANALLPLMRRLQSDKGQRGKIQLLNICVTNMLVGAADDKTGAGRDIAVMLKRQHTAVGPWRATEEATCGIDGHTGHVTDEADGEESNEDVSWDGAVHPPCCRCGHPIPEFALAAHMRYHELEG
ncbi:hypothetical protein CDD81_3254 [Ophiocordyceps australis]|uniref:UmuC domain-containing protein n=1 Tax=Ophiocordyceps australis TaxID=1399860 RepID=A0A2C5YBX4_9HYPO|nr:hypothetical protein CDD81_3254 [Ophiocordyceps australis]